MGTSIPDFTLDHPKVKIAKARFEHSSTFAISRKRSALGFEALYELFRLRTPQKEIAKRARLSPRTVGRLFKHLFSAFCEDGEDKRVGFWKNAIRIRKKYRRLSAIAREPELELTRCVMKRAKDLGYVSQRILRRDQTRIKAKQRELLINGYRCKLYLVDKPEKRTQGQPAYGGIAVTETGLAAVDVLIVLVHTAGGNRFLIIPQKVPRNLLSCKEKKITRRPPRIEICIPLEIRSKNGRPPRTDWWSYEDAWRALDTKTPTQ